MKNVFIFSCCVLCCSSVFAQYNADNLCLASEKTKEAYTYKNLQLYPIYANEAFSQAHENLGNYVSLEDALSSEKVVITEQDTLSNMSEENQGLLQQISNQMVGDHSRPFTDLFNMLGLQDNPLLQHIDPPQNRESYRLPETETPQPTENAENEPHEQPEAEQTMQAVINIFDDALLNPDLISQFATGNVNEVYITNASNDTIYLMAGEVIKGGKQDRVLANDMLVPPNTEKLEVPVFCVEKGRWAYKASVAAEFDEYYNMVSTNLRNVVQTKGKQEDVWNEVAMLNVKNEVKSETDSYTALSEKGDFQQELYDYLAILEPIVEGDEQIVGMVMVTGDKILGSDIFATHQLFQNQYRTLLHAYVTEAITNGSTPTVASQEVNAYLNDFLKNENDQEAAVKDKGQIFKVGEKKLHITTF